MPPAQSVDFLTCDSTFVDIPPDTATKELQGLPSLSIHFQPDDISAMRPTTPKAPFPLCKLRTDIAALLGCAFFMILVVFATAVIIWHISNVAEEIKEPKKYIALISLAGIALLIFGAVFVWGVLTKRHRLLIPLIFVSFIILFAMIGSVVVLFITLPDDLQENHSQFATVLLRVISGLLVAWQVYFVFCYLRLFIFYRRNREQLRDQ